MFGGSPADFSVAAPSATLGILHSAPNLTGGTAWTAQTGGTRITDLAKVSPTDPTPIAADADGRILPFLGPDEATPTTLGLWIDLGSGRRQYVAAQLDSTQLDAAIASRVSDAGSATAGALTAAGGGRWTKIDATAYNVLDHGVVLGSTSDQAAALNACVMACKASGRTLYLPAGTYYIASPLIIDNISVWAEDSVWLYCVTPNQVGIQIGVVGSTCAGRDLRLPRVRTVGSAAHTGQGVRMVDADNNRLWLPYVYDFERGLVFAGEGQGVCYNTVSVGNIASYRTNIHSYAVSASGPTPTGWSTQNTIIGGRFNYTQISSTRVAGTQQVVIGAQATIDAGYTLTPAPATGPVSGQHTFLGCSFEGDAPDYHLICSDLGSMFLACRWETSSGKPAARVWWADDNAGAYAMRNEIRGGYGVELLAQTWDTNALAAASNTIATGTGTMVGGTGGTQGAPGLAWVIDPDTGMWRDSANSVHLVAGGADMILVNNSNISMRYRGASRLTVDSAFVRVENVPFGMWPRTTAQRNAIASPAAGWCVYDTTLGKPVWSDGTAWRDASGSVV